ncbi:hypothetical protein H2200_000773 [Cladophialophora chaetospira]|uniref:Uncharacterized protein n=1 Tax=Cladophialophora chaetospira TaxID=386627 RepID=A0AA39CQN2_9EURO|nr:hypothetical protein H2200_000773 [Cladophialophora chaetospira]
MTQPVIPSFKPTSNPEFDQFLLRWRDRVFMPAAVEPHHRNLMYKPSQQQTVINEPGVTVTMDDGEEIKLDARHAFDKPNTRRSLVELARFLDGNENDTDWKNLIPFLKGLVLSQRKLHGSFPSKITRKACEVGQEQIIMKAVGQPEQTGISLRQHDVARELMLGFHTQAVLENFQGPKLARISRLAEQVALMLQDQLHENPKLEVGECDARTDPVVLAVLLELAAERALHKHDNRDQDSWASNYATKLLHLEGWKPTSDLEGATANEQNHALVALIPVQNAIKMALQVNSISHYWLGKKLKPELKSLTKLIENTAQNLRTSVGNKPRRGLQMYEQLHAMKPVEVTAQATESTPSASPAEVAKEDEQP